jgi:hypothetical protein
MSDYTLLNELLLLDIYTCNSDRPRFREPHNDTGVNRLIATTSSLGIL